MISKIYEVENQSVWQRLNLSDTTKIIQFITVIQANKVFNKNYKKKF